MQGCSGAEASLAFQMLAAVHSRHQAFQPLGMRFEAVARTNYADQAFVVAAEVLRPRTEVVPAGCRLVHHLQEPLATMHSEH